MGRKRSVIIELNPTDNAVVFHILADLRLADPQMLGQIRLQTAIGVSTSAAPHGLAGATSSDKIPKTHSERLASLDIIGSNLV